MTDTGEIIVERDLMVPERDGVRLATDVYRPAGPGPVAVIFERHPTTNRRRADPSAPLRLRGRSRGPRSPPILSSTAMPSPIRTAAAAIVRAAIMGANHMSQPRMPAPTGIAARHILALQLATPVSEALQRWRSQYSRCVSLLSRHPSKCPRQSALTASRSCNRSRPTSRPPAMTSGQDAIAPPQLTTEPCQKWTLTNFP
jgi:hypothetical protein